MMLQMTSQSSQRARRRRVNPMSQNLSRIFPGSTPIYISGQMRKSLGDFTLSSSGILDCCLNLLFRKKGVVPATNLVQTRFNDLPKVLCCDLSKILKKKEEQCAGGSIV